ncbi:MAG: hypothetical protein U0269_25005 [Polyangiales bacterium]
MTLRNALFGLALSLFGLAGCSPNVCSGNSCACPSGASCDFGDRSSATSSFSCASGATCSGKTGANSSVECGGASCTVTVGAGSTVNCSAGTCNITCTGACTTQCISGGTCNLTCQGGTTQSAAGCS